VKYEFASPLWMAALHGIIAERVARELPDKPDLAMSLCEVFEGAPAHFAGPSGVVAWSCVVCDGEIDFRQTARDDVALQVRADYAAVLPLGRYVVAGDPARQAELTALGAALADAGKLKRRGERPPAERALSSIHDAIARLTA
jgi:hypothetical protein